MAHRPTNWKSLPVTVAVYKSHTLLLYYKSTFFVLSPLYNGLLFPAASTCCCSAPPLMASAAACLPRLSKKKIPCLHMLQYTVSPTATCRSIECFSQTLQLNVRLCEAQPLKHSARPKETIQRQRS